METKIEYIPIYENVQVGTKEKIIYVASDGTEFRTEREASDRDKTIEETKRYKEVCKKVGYKDICIMDEDYFLLKVTSLEDVYTIENHKSGYAKSDISECDLGFWVIGNLHNGGDYRDYFEYIKLEKVLKDIEEIKNYTNKA